jgi:hypothetical protein
MQKQDLAVTQPDSIRQTYRMANETKTKENLWNFAATFSLWHNIIFGLHKKLCE